MRKLTYILPIIIIVILGIVGYLMFSDNVDSPESVVVPIVPLTFPLTIRGNIDYKIDYNGEDMDMEITILVSAEKDEEELIISQFLGVIRTIYSGEKSYSIPSLLNSALYGAPDDYWVVKKSNRADHFGTLPGSLASGIHRNPLRLSTIGYNGASIPNIPGDWDSNVEFIGPERCVSGSCRTWRWDDPERKSYATIEIDDDGRIIEVLAEAVGGFSHTYTRDDDGKMIKVATKASGLHTTAVWTYDYDSEVEIIVPTEKLWRVD